MMKDRHTKVHRLVALEGCYSDIVASNFDAWLQVCLAQTCSTTSCPLFHDGSAVWASKPSEHQLRFVGWMCLCQREWFENKCDRVGCVLGGRNQRPQWKGSHAALLCSFLRACGPRKPRFSYINHRQPVEGTDVTIIQ